MEFDDDDDDVTVVPLLAPPRTVDVLVFASPPPTIMFHGVFDRTDGMYAHCPSYGEMMPGKTF
jgi:hypothetical protein